jgi:predicted permease
MSATGRPGAAGRRGGGRWLDDLVRDTRHGARALGRSRGFAVAALLTIALGVGATTAVFSVVRGVLLRPLPYHEPDRLVTVWMNNPPQGIEKDITSYPNFAAWRDGGTTLAHVVAVRTRRPTLTGDGAPEEVLGAAVTRGFFEMLGVPPALGRGFRPEECEGDAGGRVVVLSHGLWVRRFGADPGVVGRTVLLDDVPHEVVGVAAAGAAYPPEAQLWTPLTFEGAPELREERGSLWLPVVGRLADGVALGEAQAQMSTVAAHLAEAFPAANEGTGITLEPLADTLLGNVRAPLMILLGSVVLVLLIAAANVANLMLARGMSRTREMAVRLALGARRERLARQVLTESALLGVVGGALGTAVAVAGVRGLIRLAPADLPRLSDVAVDVPVLAFALALALATSLAFGIVPALQAGGPMASGALRTGRGSDGGVRRLGAAFVVAQFSVALLLLAGCGLLVRSFANLRSVDPGMRTEGVLSFRVAVPPARYPDADAVRAFYDGLLPALAALPGAEASALVTGVFKTRLPGMSAVALESRPDLDSRDDPVVYDAATPGFLDVLGMRLVSGRAFRAEDDATAPRVAIVSETFVRRFLPDRDPLGERFTFGNPDAADPEWMTIVGVAADAQRWGIGEPVRPYVFWPMAQIPLRSADVLVRTAGDPTGLVAAVRAAVSGVDPSLPITNVRTLEAALSGFQAERRFLMVLLAVFAGSATALAAVGIYGVTAYVVRRRTREIGIRVAMGASRATVLASVLRQALGPVVLGVGAGLLGAVGLTRLLRSQLFGLEPTDPGTFAAVSLLLVGVGLLATWVPARRAAGVEPTSALREE